jgi:hypothetical protein
MRVQTPEVSHSAVMVPPSEQAALVLQVVPLVVAPQAWVQGSGRVNLISGSKSPNGVPVQLLMTAAGNKGQHMICMRSGIHDETFFFAATHEMISCKCCCCD